MHCTSKITLTGVLCLSLLTWAAADESYSPECTVKAAFLFKFASYVNWPAPRLNQAEAPVVIGIIGAREVHTALVALQDSRPENARPIQVRALTAQDTADDVQILFIGREAENQLKSLLASVGNKPVLTVTESPRALEAGSIINFVLVGDHVRFDISMASAEASNIKLSSRLLNVARDIHSERP